MTGASGPEHRAGVAGSDSRPVALTACVIICCFTFERWDDVSSAIDSALAQRPRPVDVIVVVDHNPELLQRLVAEVLPGRPGIRVVANAGTQGLSGARNTGLALVSAPVVAFLDDDARAHDGWLAAHLSAYDDAKVLGVGGRLVPAWDEARPGWFPHDFDWVIGCTHTGVPRDPAPIRNAIGANMSFRTEPLRGVGGFSESLGRVGSAGAGCEETEASIRVIQRHPQGMVWYVPDAVVAHRVTPNRGTWTYFRRRCVAEGRSKATVRTLSAEPLGTERDYATKILPRSFAHALREGVRGETDGFRRAGAIVGGLALTGYGYLSTSARDRSNALRRKRSGS